MGEDDSATTEKRNDLADTHSYTGSSTRKERRSCLRSIQVERIGNDLWLHPETTPEQDMGLWLQQSYSNNEAWPADFLAERRGPPPQERDWA